MKSRGWTMKEFETTLKTPHKKKSKCFLVSCYKNSAFTKLLNVLILYSIPNWNPNTLIKNKRVWELPTCSWGHHMIWELELSNFHHQTFSLNKKSLRYPLPQKGSSYPWMSNPIIKPKQNFLCSSLCSSG